MQKVRRRELEENRGRREKKRGIGKAKCLSKGKKGVRKRERR